MLFRTSDRIELSFPLRVAALAIGKEPTIEPNRLVLGERSVATDVDHVLPISFYGPAPDHPDGSAPFRRYRARLLRMPSGIELLWSESTVTGGGDFFPTPFDSLMPGVEVISTAITHLMAGDGILRDPAVRLADGMIAVLLPMILVGLLAWRRSAVGLIAAAPSC